MPIVSRLREVLLLAGLLAGGGALAGGYVLSIDGKSVELDLEQDTKVELPGGGTATLKLARKAEQQFREGGISFSYPATLLPSSGDAERRIRQHMLVSPDGYTVIVQRYDGIDPATLIDAVLDDITAEELAAGYKRKITPATRKLADGRELKGRQARTESARDSWNRDVVTLVDSRGGYMIMTMVEDARRPPDMAMVELFWRTLRLE
jgi:hypothetical protein